MIDKNFPYFHSTNPELIIKLSALNFLNKCADEIAGKGEGKYQKLLEIGKKTKEMLEEIRENMEAKKFGKLSNEIEVSNFDGKYSKIPIRVPFLSRHFRIFLPTPLKK